MSNIVAVNNNYNFPSPQEFSNLKELANIAVSSGLLPTAIKTPEQALIIMLKGRELNIPPMQAFSHIHIINGRPTMSAELMLAQIYKCIPNAVINFIVQNEKECILEAQRPRGAKTTCSFTMNQAVKAQLLGKTPWKQYPEAMLRARAISIMARALFADALMGVSYTAEELGADVELDDDGNEIIKDVTPPPVDQNPIEPKSNPEPQKPIVKQENAEIQTTKIEPLQSSQLKNHAPINKTQFDIIFAKMKELGLTKEELLHCIDTLWNIKELKKVAEFQADMIIDVLNNSKSSESFKYSIMQIGK